MMKHLLIGASALVLTTVAAQAQTVPQGTPDTVAEASVTKSTVAGVAGATFGTAVDSKSSGTVGNAVTTTAASVINGVSGTSIPTLTAVGNKSVIDQDGDSNNATVDQQGGNKGWAVVKQSGTNNSAAVDQNDLRSGDDASQNAAFVQQIGGSSANGQMAVVNQTRDDNTQTRNRVAILQGGFGNQNGGSNKARADQDGTANDIMIAQGVGALDSDQDNSAYVEQLRNGNQNNYNRAYVQQRENGNAQIFQRQSSTSSAYIVQGGGAELDSDIVQNAYLNHASNYQDLSSGGKADSFISQTSNGNNAFVNQSGALMDGLSTVFQSGAGSNTAYVQQTVAPTAVSHVSQTGFANSATARQ